MVCDSTCSRCGYDDRVYVPAVPIVRYVTVTNVIDGEEMVISVLKGSSVTVYGVSREGYVFGGRDRYVEGTSLEEDTVFTVRFTMLGDVDGDGKVGILDSLMLRRYLAGILESIDESVADVNGDGRVNSLDFLMLRYA